MKTLKTSWGTTLAVLLIFGLGVSVTPTQASVMIEVNVSNSAAVTFTATGNYSLVDDSSAQVMDGVVLDGFFSPMPFGYGDDVAGDLTPPSLHSLAYDSWILDSRSTGGVFPAGDLNLYGDAEGWDDLQEFSTLGSAFTGAATIDFSARETYLPLTGASGDITAGAGSYGSHAVIGQWLVVPEPATLSLLVLGGLALIRRRR